MRIQKLVLGLTFMLLAVVAVGFSQSQFGVISGVVTDQTGSVIANAKVTLTDLNKGTVRTTATNASGVYNIQGIPSGQYKVVVEDPGFGTSENRIPISVGQSVVLNVKLSVSNVSQVIEVTGDALATVNLENAENSQLITNVQLTQFPLATRNPYSLVALSGSVSADPSATSRGVGFNISGARSASTEILLDGLENTYLFSVQPATIIPLDAVQEYNVITSNYAPQYGRASGGVVSLVTKSGSNQFHGTVYEFYRPNTFASAGYYNNANGIPLHRFVRNNYGFSVGGPIVKNKLFFFTDVEWLKVRSTAVTQYWVPTSQLITASNTNTQAFFTAFGKISGKATGTVLTLGQIGGASGSVTTAFSDDRTALEAANPSVFTDTFPMLQQINVTGFTDAGGGLPQDTYNIVGRFDYNLSDKSQIYGRYVDYSQSRPNGAGNLSPYDGYSTPYTLAAQNLVIGVLHTFSNRLTTQTQLGGMRVNQNQPLGAKPAGPTLFINSGAAPTISHQQFVFPGYNEGNAGNGLPSGGPQNNIVISPVVTWVKGRHTFNFGGQYTYIRDNHTFAIYENAQEALLSSGTSGALVNLVNGVFNYFQANLDPQGKYPCVKSLTTGLVAQTTACSITTPVNQPNFSRSNRYHEFAGYFNDSWKITPRLTFNLGLRYDFFGTQHNKNQSLDSNFYFGNTGTMQDKIRNGQILRVTDPAPAGVQSPNGKLWHTNNKQFGPRVAFAYDLTGDGKTSLRAGYGISYERNFGNVTYNVALNPPAQLAISFTNDDIGAQIPISNGVLGSFSTSSGVTKAIPPGTVRAVDPNIKPAYAQFYTLAIERQVNKALSAGTSFTGTRGIHNYSIANYNRSYYGPVYENDPLNYVSPGSGKNTNRLNPQYTSINVRGADGDSYYNGLNTYVRGGNLLGTGVSVTANYTWSHSIDNTSSTFTDGQSNGDVGGVAYFDPYNHGLDRGASDFDARHRISASVLWIAPKVSYHNAILSHLANGWQVGTIFTASTGTPFSMYDCGLAHVTACARARFTSAPAYKRTGDAVPTGTPDNFAYITFPTYKVNGSRNTAAYGTYLDPKEGFSDLPTINGGIDSFPGGMTARNAFSGPGVYNVDFNVDKSFRFHDKYEVQLRAETFNVLNHANSYLNLTGANDVSITPYITIYKDGQRQLQLAGKIVF
jgi:hypothetical protein